LCAEGVCTDEKERVNKKLTEEIEDIEYKLRCLENLKEKIDEGIK